MSHGLIRSATRGCDVLMLAGLLAYLAVGGCGLSAPTPPPPAQTPVDTLAGAGAGRDAVWSKAFDASGVGALSAVWGSGPRDVFAVGGTDDGGEVYHFDGEVWEAMRIPTVPLLVWVFGFGNDDVFAVGVGGGVIRYDGQTWTSLDSGTDQDLWGVWGQTPDDVWIVGGNVGEGDPVIRHYDGQTFTNIAVPPNDRNATSLFKVWGIGGKTFAVGERGLILEYSDRAWFQVPAGPDADEDFISLWGTSADNIVAVGGRSSARVAVFDGQSWTTHRFGAVSGLNAVFMASPNEAIIGGVNGYVGTCQLPNVELIAEQADTTESVHGLWSDGQGRFFAVGGRFAPPQSGVAFVRTIGPAGLVVSAPRPLPETAAPIEVPDSDTLATDCNENGTEDARDIAAGTSVDCNADGRPDECEVDSDGDDVVDGCDTCPGFDDREDSDGDGVPDGCDRCAGDDTVDTDGDSVADACDICPGFDDALDSDGDSVPNGCDACPGFPDARDADADGLPDSCDTCTDTDGDGFGDPGFLANTCVVDNCPRVTNAAQTDADGDGAGDACDQCNGNDQSDADSDSVPDACDACPGFDDRQDGDGDGVPDGCDVCPGFNDRDDADADGVPAGCDVCPLDVNDDSDGDGVCDSNDRCAGPDDNADADGDQTPDGCDVCPQDAGDDSDGDGVCDSDDQCPGSDDTVDLDMDGIPDGCDPTPPVTCANQPDCPLGQNCSAGLCGPAGEPDLEFGYYTTAGVYVALGEGDALPVFAGFQGAVETYLSFRVTGFPQDAEVQWTRDMILVDDGSQIVFENTQVLTLTQIEPGVNEFRDHYMFLVASPLAIDGQLARMTATVTDINDSSVTTTLSQTIVLEVQ